MKKTLKKIVNKLGYQIYSPSYLSKKGDKIIGNKGIINIENLAYKSLSVPGMISAKSGQFLFSLCYMQDIEGDVVEIGSWQGRSTIFLAKAVQGAKNGRFFAIDHFKGNVSKEHFYVVGKKDLSDLKTNFLGNMKNFGVINTVNLLDMPNYEAIKSLSGSSIRFLFIDGDHTKEGVKKDIELFLPKLVQGAIVVFDDYKEDFPGLVETVDELVKGKSFSRMMYYDNTLVLKYK